MKRGSRLFFLYLLVVLAACSRPLTVEQQIIAVIREMEARIEAGERRPFMIHVAADFNGQNGLLTRDEFNALVVFHLRRYEKLQAQLFPINVSESGEDTAVATFRALVTGGPNWLPESGQFYHFETHWRRTDGEWLLFSARWDPVPLDEVL